MSKEFDLHAIALEMRAARDSARQIEPFTTRLHGFDLLLTEGSTARC